MQSNLKEDEEWKRIGFVVILMTQNCSLTHFVRLKNFIPFHCFHFYCFHSFCIFFLFFFFFVRPNAAMLVERISLTEWKCVCCAKILAQIKLLKNHKDRLMMMIMMLVRMLWCFKLRKHDNTILMIMMMMLLNDDYL